MRPYAVALFPYFGCPGSRFFAGKPGIRRVAASGDAEGALTEFLEEALAPRRRAQALLDHPRVPLGAQRLQRPQPIRRPRLHPRLAAPFARRAGALQVAQSLLLQQQKTHE